MNIFLILVYIYLNTIGEMLEMIRKDFLYQKISTMKKIFSLNTRKGFITLLKKMISSQLIEYICLALTNYDMK